MAQIKKLQTGGTAPQPNTISYKGVTFDKNNLINEYKNYLKTTAQNNMTGFQQGDQYNDIDEHLNNRISQLKSTSAIDENPNFTTAPTEINPITGLNTFLNKEDKSKSQQFENEAFYNFLDKSVELNKQPTTTTTNPSSKEYHRFKTIKGNIISNDYANSEDSFITGWNTKTIEDKKNRVRQALLSELSGLKNSGTKEVIGLDLDTANRLKQGEVDKYITEIPTADDNKLAEIAGHLGLNTELANLLYVAPKSPEEIALAEEKRLAAETLHQNNIAQHNAHEASIANNNKIIAANKRRHDEADAQNKIFKENAAKRLAALKYKTPGNATISDFFEGKANTADYLEAGATAADIASLAGGAVGVGAGLTGTGLQLAADITRGADGIDIAKNLGMNLGFTALALLPGVGGGAKAAYKASKLAKEGLEAAKILKGTDKILDGVKVAEEIVKASKVAGAVVDTRKVVEAEKLLETAAAIKKSEVIAEQVIKDGLKSNKFAGKLVENPLLNKAASTIRTTAVLGGINSGVNALGQTIKDVSKSKKEGLESLEDITLNDIRGLTAGVAGTRGLYHSAMGRMGTTSKTVSEAGTNIKLKNVPEGLEAELKSIQIPKGKNVKEAINEHVDNQIKLKKDEAGKLSKDTETPSKEVISKLEKLDKDIAALEASKGKITIDNGKLGTKWIGRQLGAGKVKEKTERVLKTEVDESSLVPKWLQQHAINKTTKPVTKVNEKTKPALEELEKSNKEYLKSLKRNKVKEEWDKRPKKEVVEIVEKPKAENTIKKESKPQENPLSKRTKPLKEVTPEMKKQNKENAKKALTRLKDTGKIKRQTRTRIKSGKSTEYRVRKSHIDPSDGYIAFPFKEGGVLKFQSGKPIFDMNKVVLNLNNLQKESRARKLGYVNESIGKYGHIFTNPNRKNWYFDAATNKQMQFPSTISTVNIQPGESVVKPVAHAVLPTQTNTNSLIFNRDTTHDYDAWNSPEYKNDPLKSNKDNWTVGTESNATQYTFNPNSKVKENTTVAPISVTPENKPLIEVPANNLTATLFAKPTVKTEKSNTISLPNLTEPIKALNTISTNNKITQNAIASISPLLKSSFLENFTAKTWLPIKAQGEELATQTQRLSSRAISSDANLMKASSLEGNLNATKIRNEASDKVSQIQNENAQNSNIVNNKNLERSINTANENNQSILATRQLIANYQNQNDFVKSSTINELLTGLNRQNTNRNIIGHQYELNQKRQGLINDYKAKLKPYEDKFNTEYGVEGEGKVNSLEYKNLEKMNNGLKPGDYGYIKWESPENKTNRESYENRMSELNKTLTNLGKKAKEDYEMGVQGLDTNYDPTSTQINLPSWFTLKNKKPIFKSGGSLSPAQKYEIAALKIKQKNKENDDKNFQKYLDKSDKDIIRVLGKSSAKELLLIKTILGKK